MKRDTDSGWELIEHDPMLRLELSIIEQHTCSYEVMVGKLISFFARIEGMAKLTALVCEEEGIRHVETHKCV